MSSRFLTRLAAKNDFHSVLEICKDVFGGRDFIPVVFQRWLCDPNRRFIVAESKGKVVGLTALHFVDNGKTALHLGMRTHSDYRGQGIGTKLVEAATQYIPKYRPAVEVEKGAIVKGVSHPAAVAIHKNFLFEELLSFGVVDFDISIPRLAVKLNQFKNTGFNTMSKKPKSLTADEFKDLFIQGKLKDVVACDTFLADYEPYGSHPSNISNGLVEEQDNFIVFPTDPESEAISSLSHGRVTPRLKWIDYVVSIYCKSEAEIKTHIAKHLEIAISQCSGQSCSFNCIFEKPLESSVKTFLRDELSLEEDDIDSCELVVIQQDTIMK